MKSVSEVTDWLESSDHIRIILVEVEGVSVEGTSSTFYLSSKPYVTSTSDIPANTVYIPCIDGSLSFSESADLSGSVSIGLGDIEINNFNGDKDTWLDYIWANRKVTVYIGDSRWQKSDFRIIFQGLVSDIDSRNRNSLNLILVNKLDYLNNPITEDTIGGSGSNSDRMVPLIFGECFNIEPVLVSAPLLEFMVHNGPIERIIEVRDNGAPVAAIIEDLPNGKFKLKQSPAGQITASILGYNQNGYTNTVGNLIYYLLLNFGLKQSGVNVITLQDIDSSTLQSVTFNPVNKAVGYFSQDRTNLLEVCQALAASINSVVVMKSNGIISLISLNLNNLSPVHTIKEKDIVQNSLFVQDKLEVRGSIKIGYCKNWTPQTSGLAGGIPANNIPLFNREWLTHDEEDTQTINNYKITKQATQIDTLLLTSSAAQDEAQNRLNIWKTPRYIIQMTCYSKMLLAELGEAIEIYNSRFGLDNGKTGIIISINRDWLTGRATIGVLI